VPSVVREILRRGELYTAYTPYQPEISQGILQALFEYQTMISRLTGLPVSNASLYDGASAAAEAMLLAVRATGRTRIVVDSNLHPNWREVIATFARGPELTLVEVRSGGLEEGRSLEPLAEAVTKDTACVLVPQIDFMGRVADLEPLVERAHAQGSLVAVICSPLSLSLFKSPGECDADIACGEGQELGLGLQGGGPYLGFFACKKEFVRRMPGRLVGMTTDLHGKRAFTLTLQAREQHIRREKATSNICTNHSLCALIAGLYLAAMGSEGLRKCAEACLKATVLLRERLKTIPSVRLFPGLHFREFIIRTPINAETICSEMLKRGILAGVAVKEFLRKKGNKAEKLGVRNWDEGDLLVAVTEKRTPGEIEAYVENLKEILTGSKVESLG